LLERRVKDHNVSGVPSWSGNRNDIAAPEEFTVEDERFDRIYPAAIRELSSIFWTPVAIAAEAAKLLVQESGTRVLDVGCGPGKFCLIGAALTDGHFTGVEQRGDLVEAARNAAWGLALEGAEFLHGNVTEITFSEYDAFYVFNPFEENMHGHRIDSAIPLSPKLFKRYTGYVSDQLGRQPGGTRVVTYMGYGDEIPSCYDCELTLFGNDLKLWRKTRDYDADAERLALRPSRSFHGSAGWQPPRATA
jgi:SAM-dependent methyltransferase